MAAARNLGACKAEVVGGERCSVGGCSEMACVHMRGWWQCCGHQCPALVQDELEKKEKQKNTPLNVL